MQTFCKKNKGKMSEIKVGDRVRVFMIRHHTSADNFIGEVVEIINCSAVKVKEIINLTLPSKIIHTPCWIVHRKQCRKLVKVKKCDRCKGSGLRDNGLLCYKCNGAGKIKFEQEKNKYDT